MFNATSSSEINSSIKVENSTTEIISHQIGNARNVSEEYLEVAERHIHQMLDNRISITTEFNQAQGQLLQIDVGNIGTATAFAVLSDRAPSQSGGNAGKMLWDFSGKNELQAVTLRIENSTWHELFSRLRLPTNNLLLNQTLKPIAHKVIYEELCTALKSVDRSVLGNVIILQGAAGLGKTYCAQYYFYHQAAQHHQMVAWLTGTSKEAFLRGWRALAQQLRIIDTENCSLDDDLIIKNWCENKLGQWLLIIDEVDVDAEWLAERLPRQGGHVVITTHCPNYQIHEKQVILSFFPLSIADSQVLLQAYAGDSWEPTGHPQEQKALDYLCEALGGSPIALTQMALLAYKKAISFERLANQFKQAKLTVYLLNDTIYTQLKNRTFIASVQKGWQHLLKYLTYRYPQLSQEQHEQHLKKFVDFLQERTADLGFKKIVAFEVMYQYWQEIGMSFGIDSFDVNALMNWLVCLPFQCEKDTHQWSISLAGIRALIVVSDKKPLSSFFAPFLEATEQALLPEESRLSQVPTVVPATSSANEMEGMPRIPENLLISTSFKDSLLRNIDLIITTVSRPSEFTAWQLPTKNPYFIPRPKLIEELVKKLPVKEKGEASAQLLLRAATGMGGIGKTELARHYIVEKDLSLHYQKRFWFAAINESVLRMKFQQLAAYLGLIELEKYIEDEELIMHVHKWLSSHPGWLMVFDNADNYNSIAHWIPREGGAVLVTTREPMPGILSSDQIILVPLLDVDEAVDWLYQLSYRKRDYLSEEEIIAKKLVEDLGCLPLAIAQAAAYLREQVTISIANYQTRFIELMNDATLANQGNEQMIEKNSDAYSRLIITSTWSLSLYAIETYTKSIGIQNIAEPILNSCAYLAPQDIPIILLEHWLKNLTPDVEHDMVGYMLDEYIGQLISYSLVERNDIKNTLSIHRLVQEVFRFQQSTENKLSILRNMCLISNEVTINNSGVDISLERLLLPHAEILYQHSQSSISSLETGNKQDAKKYWALIPVGLIDIYHHFGLYEKNMGFLQTLLSVAILSYGENNNITARIQLNLAKVLKDLGAYSQAEALNRIALTIMIAHYGTEMHLDVAEIQQNLAGVLKRLGNYAEAEVLYRKALVTETVHYGTESHIEVVETQQGLAVVLERLGDFAQAATLSHTALVTMIAYYGTQTHINVANIQQDLAIILVRLGDYVQAATLLRAALATKIAHYGVDVHLEVVSTQQNLAIALECLGDYAQAEVLFRMALITIIAHHGTEMHIDVAGIQGNLAGVLRQLENYTQAESLYRTALVTKIAHYGTESHIDVGGTQMNLAYMLTDLGRNQEAFLLIEASENTFQTQAGGEQYLSSCRQIKEKIMVAVFLSEQAYEALALAHYEEATSMFDNLIKLSPAFSSCYHDAACAYHLLGIQQGVDISFDKAKSYFERSLLLSSRMNTQVEYANFLRERKKYADALILLNNSIVQKTAEESTDGLSYDLEEALVLPHALAKKIRTEGAITINHSLFFAHYLKIICLLEQHNVDLSIILTSLNAFSDFLQTFRENNTENFLPIYDWFLQNATELINQSTAATCIQRFFREYIARKDLDQSEVKLSL